MGISAGYEDLIVISIVTGISSATIMLLFTFLVAFLSFRKGWDPDNVTAPLITLVGDMVTLPLMFLFVIPVLRLPSIVKDLMVFTFIVLVIALHHLYTMKNEKHHYNRILKESLPILSICGIFVLFSEQNWRLKFSIPWLVFKPLLIACLTNFFRIKLSTDMKKFVQKIISQTKANYNIIAPHFSFTREKIWPELIAFCQEIPSKLKVLDLGCGNGRLYKLLKTKEVDYLGIDFSKNLVKEAKKRHPQAKFKIADITAKKTWKNLGKFDLVFCIAVLHHLPTKALRKWVVKQVYQVLKPNAKVFVTVWNLRQKRYLKYHFSIDSLKLKWQLRDIGNCLLYTSPSPRD